MRNKSFISFSMLLTAGLLSLSLQAEEKDTYKMDSAGVHILNALLSVPKELDQFKHYTTVVVSAESEKVGEKRQVHHLSGIYIEGGDMVCGDSELKITEDKVPNPMGFGLVSSYKAEVKAKRFCR